MNYYNQNNSQYAKEINKYPLLSREEEYKLAMEARNGDKHAKDKLIVSNLRFVVKIAKYYLNNQFYLMDLVSEGNIGLMTAIDTYQPERGYRFISYAVHWIRQAIIKAIAEKFKHIKLPLNSNNNFVRIKKKLAHYQGNLTDATIEKIAQDLNLKKSEVLNLIQTFDSYDSLDKTYVMANSEKSYSLQDLLKDKRNLSNPVNHSEEIDLQKCLNNLLDTLTPMEKTVIVKRFGLDTDDSNVYDDVDTKSNKKFKNVSNKKTLQAIGKELGRTKERIRQIESKAIEKLKHKAEEIDLKIFF